MISPKKKRIIFTILISPEKVSKYFNTTELKMTIRELTDKLTQEEFVNWIAYYELKRDYEEKAIQNAKDKSRARKP